MMSDQMEAPAGAQVVVVGAGPAGLMAAAVLARYGVDVALVEARPARSALPRATVASTRTVELFRSLGLSGELRNVSLDVAMSLREVRTLREASAGTTVDVGFPTAEQAELVSPESALCVPQDYLEAVLLDHLAQQPTVRVCRGVAVRGVVAGPGEVCLAVEEDNGRRRSVSALWVVAADGAKSIVRRQLGIETTAAADVMFASQLELRGPLWQMAGDYRHLIYTVIHPDAPGVLLPAGDVDRWIYAMEHPVGERPPSRREALDRARVAIGSHAIPLQPLRYGHVSIGAELATTFRHGRVLLTGDAAHRVTPRGGTGMNTAIASGHALGWRLAWVLAGWGHDNLVDTYERDRRPAAEHNVDRSLDPAGARRPSIESLAADLGGRMAHLWLTPGRSTLDHLGKGLTWFAAPRADRRVSHPRPSPTWPTTEGRDPLPVDTVALSAIQAQALGLGGAGGLLVLPDGIPVAASYPDRRSYLGGAALTSALAS